MEIIEYLIKYWGQSMQFNPHLVITVCNYSNLPSVWFMEGVSDTLWKCPNCHATRQSQSRSSVIPLLSIEIVTDLSLKVVIEPSNWDITTGVIKLELVSNLVDI